MRSNEFEIDKHCRHFTPRDKFHKSQNIYAKVYIYETFKRPSPMKKKALLGQLSDSDIRLLGIFKSVAECGGFAAAELELNISRSTISRHIKDLEIRLGVTLCRRGRSGFALTAEGKHIYEAALRLLASLEIFRSEVNEVHQQLTGSLSIAVFDKTATNPNSAISVAIHHFDKLAPEVNLEIFVATINEIERGVMEGRFNIGIIPTHRASSSLNYHPLFSEQMYLYCGKQHPLFSTKDSDLAVSDITAYKYAGLGYHSPNMEAGHSLKLNRAATGYDQEAIAHLILSGSYLGFLPDHYARGFEKAGNIRHLLTDTFQYQCNFSAITRKSPQPSRIVQQFLAVLEEHHAPADTTITQ